eukprot:2081058-Pyramimonas_sp.AAC.1
MASEVVRKLRGPSVWIQNHMGAHGDHLCAIQALLAGWIRESLDEEFGEELEALYDKQKEALSSCLSEFEAIAKKDWHAWVTDKLDQGARNAHTALKDPVCWRPTTTLTEEGCLVSDPQSLLDQEASRFASLWKVRKTCPRQTLDLAAPLPQLSVQDLSCLSRSYPERSAVSYD